MKRILKTRYLKSGDHHQSGSSQVPQKRASTSVHRQGNRHRSDSEVDRQHQKSFSEYSITPMDPRIVHPPSVSTQQDQHDPTARRPGGPSQVSGAPRRHTVDTPHLSRVEHEHSPHKPVKQPQIESGVDRERESSMNMLQQQRPTQLKFSTSATSRHSTTVSPEFSRSMAGHTYAHSSLSPSHTSILGKGRKRVAHKSDQEIKSQRQEHKLSTPVSPTSDAAPPSKRPRIRSTTGSSSSSSKGGIRADLLKKMTKK